MASTANTSNTANSAPITTIDESHPFFLHYGENPGAILVAQPLVNDNYDSWAKSMQRALGAKSKIGFINGSLSLTPFMAKNPLLVQAWTKCNNMVVSWILNCISPKILASVVYKNIALEVWTDLKNHHFTQLNALWDEIENYRALLFCTCGSCTCSINEKLTQYQLQDSIMQFLMGLNETYSQARGQILPMDPLPSINRVYSLLIQDESQMSIGHSICAYIESTALATKSSAGTVGFGNTYGNNSGAKGKKNKGKERPMCSNCGVTGHTIEKCYKLCGYPPGYKPKGKNTKANQVAGPDFGANFGVMDSDSIHMQQSFPS
ncbi:uncharacterized protein LOC142639884 [Castanea sativa]|uniref:uncharacterized protein LOC142639884 n=1 Tax=Castanea sativa TaxID=21020 RepID=UPI003F64AC7D